MFITMSRDPPDVPARSLLDKRSFRRAAVNMAHSSDPLPPLDTLRAFEASARLGSFSAAAEELNLTHGAVSRQVQRLEGWMGSRLFERHGRGVVTTREGARLHLRTLEAFRLIGSGGGRWQTARSAELVRITALPSITGLWLIPRLSALEGGDPPLRIDLLIEDRAAELTGEAIDLAIRWGHGRRPGRIGMPLLHDQCYPIASPALAARVGAGAPERLLAHPLVNDSEAADWRRWFELQGIDYRPRRQDRRFEDYHITVEAIAGGLGIGLARPSMIGPALAQGRVVPIDSRTVPSSGTYWLDRPPVRPRPAAAALARRIIAEAGHPPETAEAFLAEQQG